MKLHLPLNLYRALLLALCAVPDLLHADNDELITTNDNTENEQITGYTNINGDIQYTDSFIRENMNSGLDIETLIFEKLINTLFYNNNGGYHGGVFSCSQGNASFIKNDNILFKENEVEYGGGAIYNCYSSAITFSDNGNINFERNIATSYIASGGAIDNRLNSAITISHNANISFTGNCVSQDKTSSYGAILEGGAISNSGDCTITISNNKNISFIGNGVTNTNDEDYASGYGGAIYNNNNSSISLSNNGNISFIGNSVTNTSYEDYSSGYGGAIYNFIDSTITFDDNENISFMVNSITSTGSKYSYAYGGAIFNGANSTVTFSNNANIFFDRNSATSASSTHTSYARGGAIYNTGSITSFDNNGNISFERNSVTSIGNEGAHAEGGAIYNWNKATITFQDNANIYFSGNSVTGNSTKKTYAYGGAIFNDIDSTITFNNNANIAFEGNSATETGDGNSSAKGGAIYNKENCTITFSYNDTVSFKGNSITSSGTQSTYAQGGAIYNGTYTYLGYFGTITFSDNGNISFEGNNATSNSTAKSYAYGGTIYNDYDSTIAFNNNANISFVGNSVTGTSEGSALGGAIYNANKGDFMLQNNGNVLFEKNTEQTGDTYRLRSIYSAGNLNLSAADNKKIEFRDSIFSSATTSFNADYVDVSGNAIKQTGDIIFTGAYTEAHLKEAKGGIDGTADEILASRTSELTGTTTLYGGRLRIEDGAIFKGRTLYVAENANATVLLRQGTLDLGSYSLTISANSTLSAIGENTINASNLNIKEGGALQLALDFAQLDSSAVLTTTGNLNMGNIAFDLTGTEYLVAGDYKLLTRTEGVNYDISGWTLNGVTADKLRWENGTLYYTGGHDWNHGVTDDDDISDLEEILGNLIINGGDVTLEVVVQAIQDAVDAGFGHGKGHIVINRGGIHISGAGDLDGHIIFNGDLKYIRKLFIEKDITNIKIELGGSSAAQNIVDVGGEYTVEIDALSGDGSMSKTGEGEIVIHGKGHKVGGTLDVQEGSLTFSVGNGATDNEAETEINELVVGNKEDKNAKVKVDKDTKVKGNKLHLDGKNAVVTNEGTMEFSGEVKVEAGHLDNQGHISKVTLEGGTVSGSGTFDGLEMNSGELIVGNSPGLQLYTDAVELKEGMVIFSLSDACIAATEETHGWDSAAYSTIDMGGNALTLSENVNFVLEIGGRALENLVAEDGSTLTFSLNLIQNIAPESLTLDEEALATLLDNTRIIITEDADGLSDSLLQLAGIDITAMLSEAQYIYEGNALVFKGTVTNDGSLTIPEPTTATLSLLALAVLAARRRRK